MQSAENLFVNFLHNKKLASMNSWSLEKAVSYYKIWPLLRVFPPASSLIDVIITIIIIINLICKTIPNHDFMFISTVFSELISSTLIISFLYSWDGIIALLDCKLIIISYFFCLAIHIISSSFTFSKFYYCMSATCVLKYLFLMNNTVNKTDNTIIMPVIMTQISHSWVM